MSNFIREAEKEPTNQAQTAPKSLKNEKPGFTYVVKRLKNLLRPPLHLIPFPERIVIDKNVEIPMSDGVILRVNVFRPATEGNFPVYGPAYYEKSPKGTCVIYSGGDFDSHLLLPLKDGKI